MQVTQRQLKKELRLPEFADVDRVEHRMEPDGRLVVDIVLKNDRPYKCQVSTHDLTAATSNGDDIHDPDYDESHDLDTYSDEINGVDV